MRSLKDICGVLPPKSNISGFYLIRIDMNGPAAITRSALIRILTPYLTGNFLFIEETWKGELQCYYSELLAG